MKKDFSIIKWLIFPFLVLGLAIGIGYVNVKMFGFEGSLLYLILLAAIFTISLILVLHTGNHDHQPAKIAAFIFETVGIFALAATVIVVLGVSRQVAGSKITAKQDVEKIEAIGKLKSAKAQSTLAKTVDTSQDTLSKVYKDSEDTLFWPLVAETLLYFAGLVTVFGLTQFVKPRDSIESTEQSLNTPRHSTRLSSNLQTAPLRVSSGSGIQNANGSTFKFVSSGYNFAIHFKEKRGVHFKYVCLVSEVEKSHLELLSYQTLADEAIKRRLSKHGEDEIVIAIRRTI